jgi:hypothetical protein
VQAVLVAVTVVDVAAGAGPVFFQIFVAPVYCAVPGALAIAVFVYVTSMNLHKHLLVAALQHC